MYIKILSVLLIVFVLVTAIVIAATAIVNMSLSQSSVWWNDTVVINGTANYTNGTAIDTGTVNITMGNVRCDNTTDSDGVWLCSFRAPLELGTYNASINITDVVGESFYNSSIIQVKLTYGETPIGSRDRVVYELPMLIQEMSGRIRWVWVNVMVWK